MTTAPLSKHLRTLFLLAVLAVAAYLSARWIFGGERMPWPIDFQVFWRTGGRPITEAYADHGMPFVYPPTALFLFKPLSLLPFLPAYFLWLGISAALFGIAVARTSGAKAAALSFLSPAAAKGITLGQSPMLLGGALFASLELPPATKGALFGLVAAVKPQLVLFAPVAFIVRREWSALAGMAGAGALAVVASTVTFGPDRWAEWLRALPHFHELVVRHNVLSYAISPAAHAEYLGLPPLPFLVAGAGIGLAAVMVMAKRVEGEMLIALIVAASLAATPYAHTHDSIALIPACIVLLQQGRWP
ncbi:MAG TPA: glycosyltransferase family 87 protein, partial [Sphingomicrobium sp.]|nr:glycosyltransferase family 87 protein [Sphingomicrobium sp.]